MLDFVSKYGFSVEINTAKTTLPKGYTEEEYQQALYDEFASTDEYGVPLNIKAPEATEEVPTQHYSNLTVPGGTNYTENEISTPLLYFRWL